MALDKPTARVYVCQASRVADMLGCRAAGAACGPGAGFVGCRPVGQWVPIGESKAERGRRAAFHNNLPKVSGKPSMNDNLAAQFLAKPGLTPCLNPWIGGDSGIRLGAL